MTLKLYDAFCISAVWVITGASYVGFTSHAQTYTRKMDIIGLTALWWGLEMVPSKLKNEGELEGFYMVKDRIPGLRPK